MNTATLIQSRPSATSPVRQTVVIHVGSSTLVYTRENAGRGANGAWLYDVPAFTDRETVVGRVVTTSLTEFDLNDVLAMRVPSSLLQRIVRKAHGENGESSTIVGAVFDDVFAGRTDTNIPEPVAQPVVTPPAVQVVREPVRQPELVSGFSSLTYPSPTDPEIASYVPRVLDDVREEDLFDFARANQKSVLVLGHAGVGKTTSIRRYASLRGLPLATVESNASLDEEQVQGALIPTEEGHFAWRNSALAEAVQQPSVVLINEATRMSPKANAMFLRILQERELHMTRHKGEVIPVHPECLIVADANWGYRGTVAPDQAFLDRFALTVEYKYDRDIERNFVPSPALLDVAFSIRDQYELGEYRSVFSTRVVKNFVQSARQFGWNFARSNLLLSMNPEDRGGIGQVLDLAGSNICDELGIAFPVSL